MFFQIRVAIYRCAQYFNCRQTKFTLNSNVSIILTLQLKKFTQVPLLLRNHACDLFVGHFDDKERKINTDTKIQFPISGP